MVQNGGVGDVALSLAHLMRRMHCEFKCGSSSFPTLMIVGHYCKFCQINGKFIQSHLYIFHMAPLSVRFKGAALCLMFVF